MARINPKTPAQPIRPPPPAPAKAAATLTPAATTSRAWGPGKVQASGPNSAAAATQTAENFYRAFAKSDLAAMGAAYDKNATFHDPLFGNLKGKTEVMDMWKTITPAVNPATFKLEPKVAANPTQNIDGSWNVKVHWDAHYDIGKRHIDNHSDTTLTIKDGKVLAQRDEWDLAAWTKQALPAGGSSKVVQKITSFAAHSFIELEAMFQKLSGR